MEEVAAVWHFEDGRIVDFKGTYEEFTSKLAMAYGLAAGCVYCMR